MPVSTFPFSSSPSAMSKLWRAMGLVSFISVVCLYFAYNNIPILSNGPIHNQEYQNGQLQFSGIAREGENSNIKVTQISNDDRKQEYLKLGLTPHPSLQIDSSSFRKTLHGRFLHITDLHPDFFYKQNTSIENSACHSGEGTASKYGDAMMGCDSPYALVEETITWVQQNLKDKIDFIIWTGDNVRHDNDRAIPRTELQIFDVNQNISDLMFEKFKDHNTPDPRGFEVPLIPSIGNNDVYPHNMFALGPTLQTRLLYRTWSSFIPQEQVHVFEKSASFLTEVIPNKLAVLSINTLYLFKSNPLVDNCDKKKQPGYTLFLWLGYTLKELRKRGMKVWLSGHVPPVPKNMDLTCYRKYTLWLYEYRDIIIGNVFGHMNLDHFVPLDAQLAYESLKEDDSMPGYRDLLQNFEWQFEKEDEEEETDEYAEGDSDNYPDSLESSQRSLKDLYFDEHHNAAAMLSSELHALGAAPGSNKMEYMESISDIFYKDLVPPTAKKSKIKLLATTKEQEEEEENNGGNDDLTISKKKKNKKKHKKKKKRNNKNDGSRYSVIHVAASVIPTFNPGFRVWEYNITNLFNEYSANGVNIKQQEPEHESWDKFFQKLNNKLDKLNTEDVYVDEFKDIFDITTTTTTTAPNSHGSSNVESQFLKKSKPDKSLPPKSKKSLPLGPAFVPQTFSPTHFVQYYLDLSQVNQGAKPFSYEVEYTSKSKPYKMDSLLANDWVKLGIELSKDLEESKKNKKDTNKDRKEKKGLWEKYLERVFVSTGYEDLARQR